MNQKNWIFVFYTFAAIGMGQADKISCDFSDSLKGSFRGYGCEIEAIVPNSEDSISIKGEHKAGKRDSDVKIIYYSSDHTYNLTKLDSTFCRKYPHLEIISLRGITPLQMENPFEKCPNLNYLTLGKAKITEIPENLFSQNVNLKELNLFGNQFKTLPEKLLENQKHLESLHLHENQIDKLPSKIFTPTTNLIFLNLDHNNIKDLDPTWFQNLTNLKTLNLNNNQISSLPTNTFVHLVSLNKLSLNNNLLIVINSDAFGNHTIQFIDLSDNNINAIDKEFPRKTNVSSLNLGNNNCFDEAIKNKNEFNQKLEFCYDNHEVLNICGRRETKGTGAIIGGQNVIPNEFPWLVVIKENGSYICGGALVSVQNVVTAAHCMQDKDQESPKPARNLKIILGVHNLSNYDEIGRLNRAVERFKIHPNWNATDLRYDSDIAVLSLTEKVTFDRYIRPICIFPSWAPPGKIFNGTIVGYGKSKEKEVQDVPLVLDMPIYPNHKCFLTNSDLADISSHRTFCAGSGNGTGVCIGDSGSGLYVKSDEIYYLRGIVSAQLFHKPFECNVDTYSIFTNVMKFFNWINRVSGNQCKELMQNKTTTTEPSTTIELPTTIESLTTIEPSTTIESPITVIIACIVVIICSAIAYLFYRCLLKRARSRNSNVYGDVKFYPDSEIRQT